MCARRFLIAVFVLTLLVVAGAFAVFQWGGQMLVKSATPKGHFDAREAGDAPDYRKMENWADWPDPIHGTNYSWLPGGGSEPEGPKPAVTFYIHPTTYLERDRWNAPVFPESGGPSDWTSRIDMFVKSEASAFNRVSNVWAPRYRQAAYGAFLLKSEDANKALDLAYGDVARAFEEFLRHNPQGPIILAGHSQGSLHLLRLLADRKDALKGRLVAAYVAGWPVGVQADLPATGLPACMAADQPGCLLSWQSFAEPANTTLITSSWVGTRGLTGTERTRGDMLCVDPVSGVADGRSSPRENPGTLVPSVDLANAKILGGQVSSRCDEGFLMIGGAVPAMGPYVLPGNNYHVYDYALFWGAVRRDAARRLAAWRR